MHGYPKLKNSRAVDRLKAVCNPAVAVLLVCLLLVAANILLVQQKHSYDSDDVSWQTILTTWRPFSGQKAYVGTKDNFVVNLPFIVLADHLASPGRNQLLIASMLMALVNFVLFYLAALYFLKKSRVKPGYKSLAPFIWLASFGVGLSLLFLNTVWRDYEIGVSFVYYALAAKYYANELHPFRGRLPKLLTLAALIVSGCFVQSDPYFLYFTVIPVALLFAVLYYLKKVPRQKLQAVLAWSILTVVFARLLTSLLARIGLLVPHGRMAFNGLSSPGASISQLLQGLGYIFGISQNGFSWWSVANLGLVLIIAGLALRQLHPRRLLKSLASNPRSIWPVFFSFILLMVVISCLVADEGGIYNYRYLLLAVYVAVLMLAIKAGTLKSRWRSLVVGITAVAVLSNVVAAYSSYASAATIKTPNAANLQLIAAVRKLGLTKGYAGYWDGNINTYLARNVEFLPVTCTDGKTVPLRLLVNGALFSKPAGRTFLVLDPAMSPPLCTPRQVMSQFGQPEQKISVANKTVLVYDYDLMSHM